MTGGELVENWIEPRYCGPDLHIRVRQAREKFGTPANMVRWLVCCCEGWLADAPPVDKAGIALLLPELETLELWCALGMVH